jgi:hypothetical protein
MAWLAVVRVASSRFHVCAARHAQVARLTAVAVATLALGAGANTATNEGRLGGIATSPTFLTFVIFRGTEFFAMTGFAVAAVTAIKGDRHARIYDRLSDIVRRIGRIPVSY